ncbi:tripartite motif-containing protein 72-like [Centruroides sculpturatus]|uniref:tripartite motif-containing protein 72-like n=1 Tax=Centruroides sculpturatus TaxID=218467 RepID=UPI000C6DD342|nr:tripartite motif-containing protein 72-like [Centruroides sculpturatus]
MKKHEAKPILVESYRRKVQEGCADHDQRPIEFFCQDDNELACSYCVVLNDSKHKGHSLILLSEKNKSCMDDLKLGIEEGKKVQSKLHKTEKVNNNFLS